MRVSETLENPAASFLNKRLEIFCESWLLPPPPFFCFLMIVFPEALMKGYMELSHSCCNLGSPSPIGSSVILFWATAIYTLWHWLLLPILVSCHSAEEVAHLKSESWWNCIICWTLQWESRTWFVWKTKPSQKQILFLFFSPTLDTYVLLVTFLRKGEIWKIFWKSAKSPLQ